MRATPVRIKTLFAFSTLVALFLPSGATEPPTRAAQVSRQSVTKLHINLGNRKVRIKYLGRGNTTGDAVVYLPKEKIVVASDLLVHPIPYTLDGYPSLWVETLERMARFDADAIVPGHGGVMRDKVYLYNVRDLLKSAVEQVNAQLYHVGPAEVHTVEEVRGGVDLSSFRRKFAGDDEALARDFNDMVTLLVNLVFKEAGLR